LGNLKKACPSLNGQVRRVGLSKFVFISDRDKGLKQSLAELLANHHAMSCAIHIQRNTFAKFGQKVSKFVNDICKTYSARREEELFDKIERLSVAAKNYLKAIPAKEWRSTEWVRTPTLPARYGITSTNISESANSMLDNARALPWLDCIDTLLDKMSTRITTLRLQNKDKSGVVPNMKSVLQKRFDNCANFQVMLLEEGDEKYKVVRSLYAPGDRHRIHTLDINEKRCSCGVWQDYKVPCVDAMAYFRIMKNQSLHEILELHVCDYYKYESEKMLLMKNIKPVILDQLSKDGVTLPPKYSGKRQAGRPKEKRLRKRSKFADESKSPIVCSRCNRRGHNKRTCTTDLSAIEELRAAEAKEEKDDNEIAEENSEDESSGDESSSSSSSENTET
jgi:Transposase, Mutator family